MNLLFGMSALPAASIETPDVNWFALTPVILVLGGGILGVLFEALLPAKVRRGTQIVWGLLVMLAAMFTIVYRWKEDPSYVGEYVDDKLTTVMQLVLLAVGFFAYLLLAERTLAKDGSFAAQPSDRPHSGEEALSLAKGYQRTEFFPLMLMSLGGMMMFPATDSLLTLFVALEVMSLPLYIMTAAARHRREISQEAALKYFLLGSFASAFFLMGSAFLYGFAGGSLNFHDIADALPNTVGMDWLLVAGVLLVMVGLLFKVAAVPFHAWTPDVYTGAPTPVTGFMAAGVKIAVFGAILRFYQVVVGYLSWDYALIFAVIAALTILVGTVGGLLQKNVKRLLAYSSICHAGFILIGALSLVAGSSASVAYYVLSYGVSTVGAFAVISLVRRTSKDETGIAIGAEANDLDQWAGLAKRSPLLAVSMLIFLLSFAGIPLTSGFVGKFVVFADGIEGGFGWLVGIALAASAATAVYYFRLIGAMFFKTPAEGVKAVQSEGYAAVVIAWCAIVTVLLGVYPAPILGLFSQIAIF